MDSITLYDGFSQDYDRFVNWDARLAFEMPLLTETLERHHVERVLDVACGTGHHAIALARHGYQVEASDISPQMIARTNDNAQLAGVDVKTCIAPLGQTAFQMNEPVDAIICLGNSLPHLLDDKALRQTLDDWNKMLSPGGLAIVQMRNFDRILERQSRYMPLERHQNDDGEWLFVRFYDIEGSQIRFHVIRLHRTNNNTPWQPVFGETRLHAWQHSELVSAFEKAGLTPLQLYGGFAGDSYQPMESADLLLIAQRNTG